MPKRNFSHHRPVCKRANKQILVDRIQAELLLEEIQLKARRTIHNENRAYPCEFGDHWHLTSEEKRAKNRDITYSA